MTRWRTTVESALLSSCESSLVDRMQHILYIALKAASAAAAGFYYSLSKLSASIPLPNFAYVKDSHFCVCFCCVYKYVPVAALFFRSLCTTKAT